MVEEMLLTDEIIRLELREIEIEAVANKVGLYCSVLVCSYSFLLRLSRPRK